MESESWIQAFTEPGGGGGDAQAGGGTANSESCFGLITLGSLTFVGSAHVLKNSKTDAGWKLTRKSLGPAAVRNFSLVGKTQYLSATANMRCSNHSSYQGLVSQSRGILQAQLGADDKDARIPW